MFNRRYTVRAAAAGVGLAAACLMPAGAAAASPGSMAVARAALASLHIGGPNRPASPASPNVLGTTTLHSSNWGGWADNSSTGNTYTAVSATWTQPAITCIRSTDTEIVGFWVGIDGLNNGTVEQDGTLAICQNGAISYFSWWEMFPTNSVQVVAGINVGDKITSSVAFTTAGYKLTVKDATTPSGSFSTTQHCGSDGVCSNASAEWIAERPSGSAGLFVLPNFRSWKVSGASVTGGTTGVISSFPDDQIFMVNSSSAALASPSALNATGNGFKVTWKASA
jgi:Peptidase A4 family